MEGAEQPEVDLAVTPVYVSFSADINPETTEVLLATMATCTNAGAQEVHLLLSTPGGDVASGIALYNSLRAMPFNLVTHNVGNVDSIGNAVFLAGDPRRACEHATFMFHGVGYGAGEEERLEEKDLREHLGTVLASQARIASIMVERTRLTEEAIKPLFLEATTRDATFAHSNGIVDEVADVEIPPGSPVEALVFER